MLFVLLSFIYCLFVCHVLGFGFKSLFKLECESFTNTVFLGLFSISILASIWAFCGRIHWEFQVVLCSGAIAIVLFKWTSFYNSLLKALKTFQNRSAFIKILGIFITALIVMQCAASPYILDNESYYIQTITSFNDFGFLKGLANVHVFLGQASNWHVTQAALNLNFLYSEFNDLSGFCFLITMFWSLNRLNSYLMNPEDKLALAFGLLPLASLFFLQFISTPSPDVPIYCMTFIGCYLFLKHFNAPNNAQLFTLYCLLLFMLSIKVTSIAMVILPIVLLVKFYKKSKAILPKFFIVSILVFGLFLAKNIVISGYPLFPSMAFNVFNVDWKLPETISSLYYETTRAYGFLMSPEQLKSISSSQLFIEWITLGKMQGIMNKLALFLLVLVPLCVRNKQYSKGIYWVYCVFVIQLLILFFTSPQYRFYFSLMFPLLCLCGAFLMYNYKMVVKTIVVIASVIPLVVVFGFISKTSLANNDFSKSLSTFSVGYLIEPHPNTKFSSTYKPYKEGNFIFYHPENIEFFWGTGDGPFPTLNLQQYNYFKKNYNIIPQQRMENIKYGFYSKLIENDKD